MAIAEGRPVAASPQCSQQRDNEGTSVSQLFPTCSECKQTIIFTDKMRRCTNPACGRVVCEDSPEDSPANGTSASMGRLMRDS